MVAIPASSGAITPSDPRAMVAGQLQEQLFERPAMLHLTAKLLERADGQHPAVIDDADPVGQLFGDRQQMGGHQHGAARPSLGDEQVLDDPGAARVEPDQGLVHDQDLGVVHQGRGEHDALFHPLRVVFAELVDVVAHLERLDQLVDPLGGPPRLEAVHLHDELEELATGQLVVKIRLIGNVAQELASLLARRVETTDPDRARGRSQQPADHLDRGRLARAVGPEKREQLAGADLQVEPVDGALGPKPLGHAAYCDHEPGTLV